MPVSLSGRGRSRSSRLLLRLLFLAPRDAELVSITGARLVAITMRRIIPDIYGFLISFPAEVSRFTAFQNSVSSLIEASSCHHSKALSK